MKKLITLLGIVALLSGCGTERVFLKDGANGSSGANGADGLNGANGQDGFNSLITLTRLEAEQELCQTGGGLLFASGLDTNRNGLLDLDEVAEGSIAMICDGAAGPQGPQGPVGPAGADGINGTDGQDGANGQDGAQGEPGIQGPAGADGANGNGVTLTAFTLTTTCQQVADGLWAAKNGTTANIYDDADCGSHDKVASLVENSDEIYMTANQMFIVENGPSSVKLYKVQF